MESDDLPLIPQQVKALFAEWTEDYAAAKERNRNAGFGAILDGTVNVTPKSEKIKDREIER